MDLLKNRFGHHHCPCRSREIFGLLFLMERFLSGQSDLDEIDLYSQPRPLRRARNSIDDL